MAPVTVSVKSQEFEILEATDADRLIEIKCEPAVRIPFPLDGSITWEYLGGRGARFGPVLM